MYANTRRHCQALYQGLLSAQQQKEYGRPKHNFHQVATFIPIATSGSAVTFSPIPTAAPSEAPPAFHLPYLRPGGRPHLHHVPQTWRSTARTRTSNKVMLGKPSTEMNGPDARGTNGVLLAPLPPAGPDRNGTGSRIAHRDMSVGATTGRTGKGRTGGNQQRFVGNSERVQLCFICPSIGALSLIAQH